MLPRFQRLPGAIPSSMLGLEALTGSLDHFSFEDYLNGSYNHLLGTNNPTKTSWPELVGVTAEEAEKKIKEEMAGVEIQVVFPGYSVTFDYKIQRVRLYVDESKKPIFLQRCLDYNIKAKHKRS
ncbi:subtilisin inhibitor 1-like isoform X3 [Gastrolobium bilobum]|uniref:subtilisin inhibitor 1-like isoform X3 n=1 Tax=Gastrolobium bilobum TaxID=150636 RepID=UPI002AB04026|nr:subtilisin inhibitor 1-like isoform X3 [Gastrolobium bilobum]XP_061360412.1 subtilisin inhibitor 1-like isoform X3 [Gastrolobium bilobum]XP_061360413.1 subtilisin inhibitor 1-like isoform X3 [Gastrolobium bilobum]